MSTARKTIAVMVTATSTARAREALRGAIGLSLRGDRVVAVLAGAQPDDDAAFRRHRTMLAEFGHAVTTDPAGADAADVVEVWSDGEPGARALELRRGDARHEVPLAALSPDEILDLVFEYDVAVVR